MKDKYLIIALMILIPVNVVLTYRNVKGWNDDHIAKVGKMVMNVLPKNEDKDLVEPDEVRQYVLAMADIKGVNVNMVDKIGNCESRWRYDAVSKSGTYVGVFQIGKLHGLGDDRLDVVKSTKWSLEKMKREGFGAWECATL